MSFINSATLNELSCCLSEKNSINNQNFKKINLYSYNLKRFPSKNVYNKLNSLKLNGKEKYKNFTIFGRREIELRKNKKIHLNLSLKKLSSLNKNKTSSLLNPINITENMIKGDYTKLPILLEKIQSINSINKAITINNNKNSKINNTNNSNEKIVFNKTLEELSGEKNEENGKTGKVRQLFLTKLKNNLDKEELNKKLLRKTESHALIKKNIALNRHIYMDKSCVNYISKLNEYIINKYNYDLKNEQYLQIKENNRNKMEFVNDKIKSMRNTHKFFEDIFLEKYNDFFRKIMIIKDKENNNDLMLCKKIYSLRNEIKVLENKIIKLKNEKNIYVRWMFLQIQIKQKMINIPKNYKIIIKEGKNSKNNMVNYLENIIYKDPDEINKQLKKYENENINLIKKYNKNKYKIDELKEELNNENKENINNYFKNEINKKNIIKQKLLEQYNHLEEKIQKIKNIYNITNEINNKNDIKNIIHSKLYKKIKLIKINIVGENPDDEDYYFYYEKPLEEDEMVEMMRKIEIAVGECLKKKKLYIEKYKIKYEKEKEKLEQNKKKERIRLHQKYLKDRFIKLKEKIIQKTNKIYILPTKKINWQNPYLYKEFHSDDNNYNHTKKENNINYFNFDSDTEINDK